MDSDFLKTFNTIDFMRLERQLKEPGDHFPAKSMNLIDF